MTSPAPPTENPYSPPPTNVTTTAENRGKRLATRGERFVSAIIDGMLSLIVGWLLTYACLAAGFDPFPRDPMVARMGMNFGSPMLAQLCALVPAAGQWALIAATGQSVGKKIVGLRIGLADGSTAGLYHGVVLRALPQHLISFVPSVLQFMWGSGSLGSMLVSLVIGFVLIADLLFIFDASYRCVHDRIAGTWVVALK